MGRPVPNGTCRKCGGSNIRFIGRHAMPPRNLTTSTHKCTDCGKTWWQSGGKRDTSTGIAFPKSF